MPSHSSQRNGPACPPLALPSCPPSCSTCHAVDGGALLPPQTPCQLGSTFAMSISLPNGTVPTFPLTGLLWDWAQCSPLRKRLGPSLQPLWRPLVSSVSATVWVSPGPAPQGASQLGEVGASSLTRCPLPLSAPETAGPVHRAGYWGYLPCLASVPVDLQGLLGWREPLLVFSSSPWSSPFSQLLYLKVDFELFI